MCGHALQRSFARLHSEYYFVIGGPEDGGSAALAHYNSPHNQAIYLG